MDPLWASLLNSDWHDHRGSGAREDRIGNDEWLGRFLERAGWALGRLPNGREREALKRLRALLRGIVETYRTEGTVASEDVEALNRILEGAPLIRRLDEQGDLTLFPVAEGILPVLGEIIASFASMLARGEHTRVKICANPDCGWVIFDESRNQTRRWCSAAECGNLIKVRKHRRSKREGPPTTRDIP